MECQSSPAYYQKNRLSTEDYTYLQVEFGALCLLKRTSKLPKNKQMGPSVLFLLLLSQVALDRVDALHVEYSVRQSGRSCALGHASALIPQRSLSLALLLSLHPASPTLPPPLPPLRGPSNS